MKTGRLFNFEVSELPAALQDAFADKAITLFDGKDEVQCGSCLHQNSHLYVVAETKRHALRAINDRKMGLCADCIAELIATEGWQIMSPTDRF